MSIEKIVLATVIAVTVEALVEYGKTIITAWHNGKKAVLLQGAAVAVSVCLCLLSGADVYGALGIHFAWMPAGCILTGVFAARGANYISDLVGRLRVLLETA